MTFTSAMLRTTSPTVVGLHLFPVKSLDGTVVEQATLLASGALQSDREFALFDASGNYINGKRNQRIHALRAFFNLNLRLIQLQMRPETPFQDFHLDNDRPAIAALLGDYFEQPVELRQNLEMGFPDDKLSPGPTIISTATLAAVASWYPHLTVDEIRARFRTNIEIDGVPAFWEDRLFGTADTTPGFKIGDVEFLAVNPCQRCIVVTRDAVTGEGDSQFQKTFTQQRQSTLPAWAEASRFNHFFRLAINTRVVSWQAGKVIRVGDKLSLNE
jgi:uncharacterized protein YcbX